MKYKNLPIAEILLSNGAGETLLHIAVRNKIIDIIELLIDYGADIDAKDDNGMTTIDYAAKSGNADVFNFLTEQSVPWY
ncbi:ankyrin [Orientia tsutsugamushi]|uniref:Ankyrin n=1 Tax=Orientia tsutsugamushi TaxID=784 RepID=A0A2U3QSE1_ORITS|nr:ankyrin [Orientia tsutsugamushi]